jgi:hypothetical protein
MNMRRGGESLNALLLYPTFNFQVNEQEKQDMNALLGNSYLHYSCPPRDELAKDNYCQSSRRPSGFQ